HAISSLIVDSHAAVGRIGICRTGKPCRFFHHHVAAVTAGGRRRGSKAARNAGTPGAQTSVSRSVRFASPSLPARRPLPVFSAFHSPPAAHAAAHAAVTADRSTPLR